MYLWLESFLELDLPEYETASGSRADTVPAVPDILARLIYRVYAQVPGGIPSYLAGLSASFEQRASRADWPADPQLGPTTAVTAAMLVRAAVGLAAGEPVKVVPDVNFVDLRELMAYDDAKSRLQ
jgi:hypothetical protein